MATRILPGVGPVTETGSKTRILTGVGPVTETAATATQISNKATILLAQRVTRSRPNSLQRRR